MRRGVFRLQSAVLRYLAVPGLALLIGIGSAVAQSGDSKAQDQGKPAANGTQPADAAKDGQRKTDEFAEAAQAIKDRRQVVRSLKDRLRTSFNVSVAELDAAELWNRATIGVVSISNSRDYLDGLMKNVERAATRIANNHGADIADSFVEYF